MYSHVPLVVGNQITILLHRHRLQVLSLATQLDSYAAPKVPGLNCLSLHHNMASNNTSVGKDSRKPNVIAVCKVSREATS